MAHRKPSRADSAVDLALAERRHREKSYREQALKMFAHVCGRCGREFTGKKLKELTVHHRDHNHDYNPPDGSNWELLCIYCHENEHSRLVEQDRHGSSDGDDAPADELTHKPFAALANLLKK
jgi:5-methylcytosine-specific restriction endonuclease McrA